MMQCSDTEGIMKGNRDGVGFAVNDCPNPDMAPGLVDTLIFDKREASLPVHLHQHHGGVLYRDQFFPYEMEPDDTGAFIVIEMAGDRILHHGPEFLKRICPGKNGMPERSGFVSSLGSFFNDEDDFLFSVHGFPYSSMVFFCLSKYH
jgi:hypothetical protein